ncbi:IS66 family insertion sequence element accessory protein TnpA [Paenibacillus periandrae]|uniref:IS66 family insertion sequence element accessory protein TnpA n=1 Tax=Paenibacillus periandrae TaxID=1761741 RepID=UPI001F0909AA|nr:IS66 family insertion sequence element accessory protein TnpB [Paenibacillus periandrae]
MDTNLQALWSERTIAYQASGQTMKAWCGEQNLTVHQLKYWLYKAHKQQNPAPAQTTFRAVTVTPPEPESDPLWVQIGPARIGVRSGFQPNLLREAQRLGQAAVQPLPG